MDLINHSITLTLHSEVLEISKTLTEREIITMLGFQGIVYNGEVSLFCLACEVFRTMDEEDLLIFLDYSKEDWDYYWSFVEKEFYSEPLKSVDCRKN